MSGLAMTRALDQAPDKPGQEVTLPQSRSPVILDIQNLQRSLADLDRALRRFIPAVTTAPSSGSEPERASRRVLRLTPRRKAALVLQGRYMGLMRGLKPRQKAQVRKIKHTRGVQAAIGKARTMARA